MTKVHKPPQFRLRSLFILTTIVAVGCAVAASYWLSILVMGCILLPFLMARLRYTGIHSAPDASRPQGSLIFILITILTIALIFGFILLLTVTWGTRY
jgi:hypothetical protein